MADHTPGGPLELGAEMNYGEHEKTYDRFLALTKYGALACAALLISMAFGFFAGGFFSALVLFILICGLGAYLLR